MPIHGHVISRAGISPIGSAKPTFRPMAPLRRSLVPTVAVAGHTIIVRGPRSLRTATALRAHLEKVGRGHPTPTTVVATGDSWLKTNDVNTTRVTKKEAGDCAVKPDGAKPRFVLTVRPCAREIATGEGAACRRQQRSRWRRDHCDELGVAAVNEVHPRFHFWLQSGTHAGHRRPSRLHRQVGCLGAARMLGRASRSIGFVTRLVRVQRGPGLTDPGSAIATSVTTTRKATAAASSSDIRAPDLRQGFPCRQHIVAQEQGRAPDRREAAQAPCQPGD